MASRLTNQFLYSFDPKLSYIEGSFSIAASGAVGVSNGVVGLLSTSGSSYVGRGIAGVVKQATGQYQINLTDKWSRFVGGNFDAISPTSAAGSIQDGSIPTGKPYMILFPSTSTNWYTLGLPTGFTPAYGMPFVASSGASNGPSGSSGATAAGNGTVIPIITSGVTSIEMIPNMNTMLQGNSSSAATVLNIQTLGTSANIPASPTSGTVIRFNLFFRDSSLVLNNELPTNY